MLFSPCGGCASGSAGYAAWVAGLVAADCESDGSALFFSVSAVSGGCSSVDDAQGLNLLWDAGESKWVSEGDFTHAGGAGPVRFWVDAGRPRATVDGVEGVWVSTSADGLGFSFGGLTLCTSGGCDSYFLGLFSCQECPSGEGVFQSPQFTVPPGATEEGQFQVSGVTEGTPPDWAQFQLTVTGAPDGLEQFQLVLVAPDGTQFQLAANPTGMDDSQYQVLLRLSQADDYAQFQLALLGLGAYEVDHGNFQTYSGPVNGDWQFQVVNQSGDATLEVEQFQLVWGAPAHNLTLTLLPTPSSGTAPLSVSLDWAVGGAGECFFVEIDWGDGSDKEFFLPGDKPQNHAYSPAGSYTIVGRAWSKFGTYAEDTAAITATAPSGGGEASCYDVDTELALGVLYETTSSPAATVQWYRWAVTPAADYRLTFAIDAVSPPIISHASKWNSCALDGELGITDDSGCYTVSSTGGYIYLAVTHSHPDNVGRAVTFKLELGTCP